MRRDMHEVLIERPRGGWRGDRRVKAWDPAIHEHEDIPKRESTSRHRGGTKHLSDLLGPLRRFLERSVGRRWDDVYSELRQGLSPKSALHMHILDHARFMVNLDGGRWGRFEICPRTGVLRRVCASWRVVRDPDRGDEVSPRRFLLRRLGRPWQRVLAEAGAVGLSREALERLVRVSATRARRGARPGRICARDEAPEGGPARVGAPLGRGVLYVVDGVLGVVP